MTTPLGVQSWLRACDPLAARILLVGVFAGLSYGAALVVPDVVPDVVHVDRSATLRAGSGEYVVALAAEGSVDDLVAQSLGDATITVPRDGAMDSLVARVHRLAPTRVVILGGSDVISERMAAALTAGTTTSAIRLAGPDRYTTAARAAVSSFPAPVAEALVVLSDVPPAAAGAAATDPVPAVRGTPVLLVGRSSVPPATLRALQQLRPGRLTVVGAPSDAVMQTLRTHTAGEVRRVPAP